MASVLLLKHPPAFAFSTPTSLDQAEVRVYRSQVTPSEGNPCLEGRCQALQPRTVPSVLCYVGGRKGFRLQLQCGKNP